MNTDLTGKGNCSRVRHVVVMLATTVLLWSQTGNLRAATILVANRGAGMIGAYDSNTGATISASLVTGLSNPSGLAVSGGNVFVTNMNTGVIGVYNALTGAVVNASLITGLNSPNGIVAYGGDLFVVQSAPNPFGIGIVPVVSRFTLSGALVNTYFRAYGGAITGDYPWNLAVSGTDLYVSTGGGFFLAGVYKASLSGNGDTQQIFHPSGIAVSGGDVFIADGNTLNVRKYDSALGLVNGSFITLQNNPDFGRYALAVDSGDLFVDDFTFGTIGKYNANTGATINASLVTGASGPIAVVPSNPVPEPTGVLLFWTGAAFLGLLRRRT